MNEYAYDMFGSGVGTLDALARVELLSGDPTLDRRLSVLADSDPLGLRVPRRIPLEPGIAMVWTHDAPERQICRLPLHGYALAARNRDADA
jgi:hypothetical protein